jgi:hypothetical protein
MSCLACRWHAGDVHEVGEEEIICLHDPSSERHEMLLLSSDFVPVGREKSDSPNAVVGRTGANIP